jgi:hypothetical protein
MLLVGRSRTLGSLSIHVKLRLNRVRTSAASMADPAVAATLERAMEAATAWQHSLRPAPVPAPVPSKLHARAASLSDHIATEAEPAALALGAASLDSPRGISTHGGRLMAATGVGVLAICAAGLFFRARTKMPLPVAAGSRPNMKSSNVKRQRTAPTS